MNWRRVISGMSVGLLGLSLGNVGALAAESPTKMAQVLYQINARDSKGVRHTYVYTIRHEPMTVSDQVPNRSRGLDFITGVPKLEHEKGTAVFKWTFNSITVVTADVIYTDHNEVIEERSVGNGLLTRGGTAYIMAPKGYQLVNRQDGQRRALEPKNTWTIPIEKVTSQKPTLPNESGNSGANHPAPAPMPAPTKPDGETGQSAHVPGEVGAEPGKGTTETQPAVVPGPNPLPTPTLTQPWPPAVFPGEPGPEVDPNSVGPTDEPVIDAGQPGLPELPSDADTPAGSPSSPTGPLASGDAADLPTAPSPAPDPSMSDQPTPARKKPRRPGHTDETFVGLAPLTAADQGEAARKKVPEHRSTRQTALPQTAETRTWLNVLGYGCLSLLVGGWSYRRFRH